MLKRLAVLLAGLAGSCSLSPAYAATTGQVGTQPVKLMASTVSGVVATVYVVGSVTTVEAAQGASVYYPSGYVMPQTHPLGSTVYPGSGALFPVNVTQIGSAAVSASTLAVEIVGNGGITFTVTPVGLGLFGSAGGGSTDNGILALNDSGASATPWTGTSTGRGNVGFVGAFADVNAIGLMVPLGATVLDTNAGEGYRGNHMLVIAPNVATLATANAAGYGALIFGSQAAFPTSTGVPQTLNQNDSWVSMKPQASASAGPWLNIASTWLNYGTSQGARVLAVNSGTIFTGAGGGVAGVAKHVASIGAVATATTYSVVLDPAAGGTLTLGSGGLRWEMRCEPLAATEFVDYSTRSMSGASVDSDGRILPAGAVPDGWHVIADWLNGTALTVYLAPSGPGRSVRLWIRGLRYP